MRGIKERLKRALIPHLIDLIANPAVVDGLEEDSRSSDAPFTSSNEE